MLTMLSCARWIADLARKGLPRPFRARWCGLFQRMQIEAGLIALVDLDTFVERREQKLKGDAD
jgi:hypothetical protein